MAKRCATGFFVFLLACFSPGKASVYLSPEIPDSTTLQLHYRLYAGTESVPGKFARKLILGGYLNHALKQDTYNQLSDNNNLAGLDISRGMDFYFDARESGWQWSAHFSTHQLHELSFSRSSFHLLFFGNAPSIGKEYPFNFHYRELSYQLWQGGIHYRSQGHYAGVRLGPASGSSYFSGQVESGSLYTHSNGQYMDLMLQGQLHWSDTAMDKTMFGGTGMAGSITYGYETQEQKVFISLDNLGVISYRMHISSDQDSMWHYEGVEANLLEMDEVHLAVTRDSLLAWSDIQYNGSNQQVLLPASIKFAFVQGFQNHRYSVGLYGNYPLFCLARPRIWIVPGWQINPLWKLTGMVAHGGYSGLTTGLGVNATFENGLTIRLESSNLLTMWHKDLPATAGLIINASKSF